jgi:cell division septation protein DedD
MSNQSESKVDTVVKVVLVFFVCLLSFSVGTYAGKRFSDYQHRMAQLTGEQNFDSHQKELTSSLETHSDSVSITATEEATMTAEDVAKLAASLEQGEAESIDLASSNTDASSLSPPQDSTTGMQASQNSITHTQPSHSRVPSNTSNPGETPKNAVTGSHNPQKAQGLNEGVPSNLTSNEKPKGSPERSLTSVLVEEIQSQHKGQFTVQVAAFPIESEAEKLTQSFVKKGLSAFSVTAKVADKKNEALVKTWYRVNIGLFSSQKEAETYKNELVTNKLITNGFVQKL